MGESKNGKAFAYRLSRCQRNHTSLANGIQDVLGEQFVGMYLYGSLSGGDFNPASSDIDFLITTTDILREKRIGALSAMHQRIWDSGLKWASKLEGSDLPQGHLPRYEKSDARYPTVNEGKFYVAPLKNQKQGETTVLRAQKSNYNRGYAF